MILDLLLPSFAFEFAKIAFQAMAEPTFETAPAKPKRLSPKAKVERHFESADPNWAEFEKNLKSKKFHQAVRAHPMADEKLKKYVASYGAFVTGKDVAAEIKSKDSGKKYVIKDLHTGRLGCSCKDWQYRRSHGGGDCKHIRSFKQSGMRKESSAKRDRQEHRIALKASIPVGAVGAGAGYYLGKKLDVSPAVVAAAYGASSGLGTYFGLRRGFRKMREKEKQAFLAPVLHTASTLAAAQHLAKKNLLMGQIAKQTAKETELSELERRMQKMM